MGAREQIEEILLEPIASQLGIKLTLSKNLHALEEVKEEMQNIFLSGKFR